MSQLFDKIRVSGNKRSTFDLSHNQVMTTDFGYLVPICVRDMVPNDDFVVNPQLFTRLAPMAVPTYGRVKARVHHFFVPYRILYPKWDMFVVQDPNNYTVPPYFQVSFLRSCLDLDPQFGTGVSTNPRGRWGRLMAAIGLNPELLATGSGVLGTERISAFPFLAYYRIWLDWFMDSSIYDHSTYDNAFKSLIASGGNLTSTMFLETRSCCYKKDYFTTARVSPQGGSVSPSSYTVDPALVAVDVADASLNPGLSGAANSPIRYDPVTGHVASNGSYVPSNATSVIGSFTVEAMRAANSVQRYLERNNFVGSKLINRILAHFGVSPTPERLDMAEFIGGDSFDIRIGDVTSTSTGITIGTTSGLGLQAGKGVGANRNKSVRYHAKEHGVFMSVLSVVPDTSYYQGISRMFQKGVYGDPLDFFTPEFENLGYQPILNKEVYVPNASAAAQYQSYDPDGVFGYSPRYSEYKFHQDILAGDFVGSHSTNVTGANLDSWHLFRKLHYSDNDPVALNENFVELRRENTDYDRIFQVTNNDYDHFYFNIFCDVKATRPMDGFSAPSLDATNQGDGNSISLPYGGTRL